MQTIVISDITTVRGVLAEITITTPTKKVVLNIEKQFINRVFLTIGKIGIEKFINEYSKLLGVS